MAAVGIGAHLDLVDGKEGDQPVHRHRVDGAQEITRVGGDDLFLAGDQGDLVASLEAHRPVVVLARQQTQGKTDHAAGVSQHAVERQVGLARVGRPEDGLDAVARRPDLHQARITLHRPDFKGVLSYGPVISWCEFGVRLGAVQVRCLEADIIAIAVGPSGVTQLGHSRGCPALC